MKCITGRVKRAMRLMKLIGFIGLAGCSSEDFEKPAEKLFPVNLMGMVTQYEEATEATRGHQTYELTRTWTPPSGYTLIGAGNYTIGAFLTRNGDSPTEGFFYSSGSTWHTTLEIEDADTYYLYGYMPHTSGVTCTISSSSTDNDNSSYNNGAVLKIRNLPAITSNDICVVVGAKNGKNDYNDDANYSVTGLRRSDFAYVAQAGNNYIFLIFDHLYSALRVRMRVDGDYNALRTIKLKELYLQTSASGTVTKKRLDAIVTLRATNGADNTDPISSVVYTPVGTDESDGMILGPFDESVILSTDYSSYMSHFMPQGIDKLVLTSVYDVYDKKGNLVRENCRAKNTLILNELFSEQDESRRGCRYTVNLTIKPTYIFSLSESDLDNPGVSLSE